MLINLLNNGYDQVYSNIDTEDIQHAVETGIIDEQYLNITAHHILTHKFSLGQFESLFINENEYNKLKNTHLIQQTINQLQRKTLVLLEYKKQILPLSKNIRVYLVSLDPKSAQQTGLHVVDDISHADVAIIRLSAPYSQIRKNARLSSEERLAIEKELTIIKQL